MKKDILFMFIMLIILANPAFSADKNKDPFLPAINKIYSDYGVRIVLDTKFMVPKYWLISPINGRLAKLDAKYYTAALQSIAAALRRYPKAFLRKNLCYIGLCGAINFYDIEYGGTAVYEYHGIILAVRDWTKPAWIDATVSHELNHLLVYWHDFPKDKWMKCNNAGFVYGSGGIEAIRDGESGMERKDSVFREGFVCEYAKSDFIEDVATTLEYAMTDRTDFYARALKYPVIKMKFEILKKFYHRLDAFFDEKYWSGSDQMNAGNKKRAADADNDAMSKSSQKKGDEIDNDGLLDEDDNPGGNDDNSLF